MNRKEKNALSRQRILEATMREFSAKGYANASLNTVCAEHNISKGIIYHYFKDKDELYLLCVKECFDELTAYMKGIADELTGMAEERIQAYFDARIRFFANNPICFGIFADASFNTPVTLAGQIADCRRQFDMLNISVLTNLLNGESLRKGISIQAIVEDFSMYMDFFNMRFKDVLRTADSCENIIREHEERCHRQLDIMLRGVLGENDAK